MEGPPSQTASRGSANTANRPILWGFPCGSTLDTDWGGWVCGFMDRTRHLTSMPLFARQAGRIDIARSYLLEMAKAQPKFKELLTFDTDVMFHDSKCPGGCDHEVQGLDLVQEYLEEDFALGFDVVHAPVLNTHGNPSFGFRVPNGWLGVSDVRAFPADWCTGAFLAFSRKAIDTIRPITEIKNQDGSKVKLYCRMLPETTEDYDLCENLSKCGLRLGVDPRLIAGHHKGFTQYAQPGSWHVMRNAFAEALEKRAARLKG